MPDPRHIAVAFAGASAFLNLYAPQALLPLLAQEFGAGPAHVSLTITASTAAVALTAPFTGAIADVVGRKLVITCAMLALIVPTVMVAFAQSLQAMILWRFAQGLMMPPIFAVIVAYIGEEWPAAEATGVTGIYTSAASFGGFLGRFLTGLLADSVGWRGAFLADAALTLVCAAMVILLLPRERRFVRQSSLAASGRQMLRHLRNPRLLATFAIGFGVLFCFIAIFTYVSFHLAAPPFALSATLVGSIFVVYLVGTVTTPLTGRLVRRFGRRAVVIANILAWIVGLALMLTPSLPAIVLGLAIAAACGFQVQTASTSFVTITAEQGASSAVGLYVTSFYVGGSVGAAAAGLAWNAGGWPATVALAIGMLGLMALIVATAWRHH